MTIGELHKMLTAALAENPGWATHAVLVVSSASPVRGIRGEHMHLPGAGIDYQTRTFNLPVEREQSTIIGRR